MRNCAVYGWPKKSDISFLHSGHWNLAKASSTWISVFKAQEFLSALTKPSDNVTFPAAGPCEGCVYHTGGHLPNYPASIPLQFLLSLCTCTWVCFQLNCIENNSTWYIKRNKNKVNDLAAAMLKQTSYANTIQPSFALRSYHNAKQKLIWMKLVITTATSINLLSNWFWNPGHTKPRTQHLTPGAAMVQRKDVTY